MKIEEFEAWLTERWSRHGDPMSERDLTIMGLGIGGEAGEVQEHIKKLIRDGKQPGHDLLLELGDVLHYTVRIAQRFGWTASQVMEANVDKLNKRDAEKDPQRYSRVK